MSDQHQTINNLREADINADDWPDAVLDNIPDKYARGYLNAQVSRLNEYLSFASEDFREELIEVAEYNSIWGK